MIDDIALDLLVKHIAELHLLHEHNAITVVFQKECRDELVRYFDERGVVVEPFKREIIDLKAAVRCLEDELHAANEYYKELSQDMDVAEADLRKKDDAVQLCNIRIQELMCIASRKDQKNMDLVSNITTLSDTIVKYEQHFAQLYQEEHGL